MSEQRTDARRPRRTRSLVAIVGVSAAVALKTLVPQFEGTVYPTYRDMVGRLTYCTGATENAIWGKVYTPDECRAQLEHDLARHAEGVDACVPMKHLTVGQRIAFVDAAYNLGVETVCHSSMARQANAGQLQASCDALLAYNHAGGRVVAGLTRRRQEERRICMEVQ